MGIKALSHIKNSGKKFFDNAYFSGPKKFPEKFFGEGYFQRRNKISENCRNSGMFQGKIVEIQECFRVKLSKFGGGGLLFRAKISGKNFRKNRTFEGLTFLGENFWKKFSQATVGPYMQKKARTGMGGGSGGGYPAPYPRHMVLKKKLHPRA